MRVAVCSIAAAFVLLSPTLTAIHGGGGEPAGDLDVSARAASRIDLGSSVRVVVELKLRSAAVTPAVTIGAKLENRAGWARMPDRVVHLPGGAERRVRYTLDLAKGVEHHLTFAARSESEPSLASSAYLRVNLDPAREPADVGDLLQFRARMEGEVAP